MDVTPEDRRALDALKAEIDNPATREERRDACRDEFESIAGHYVGNAILADDDDEPPKL